MIKNIFLDLDGTLLPVNEDEFTKLYFGLLYKRVSHRGYEKDAFVKAIWTGVKAIVKNDGSKTNEQVFWDCFKTIYGEKGVEDKAFIDELYTNEFAMTKQVCQDNIYTREIIKTIKDFNLKVALTTQPVFPLNGVITRMGFVGLKPEDFDLITSYENSYFAKPNPKYYQEVLDRLNLKSNEVIMFGNDKNEDCESASSLGIKCYLVGDYIKGESETNFEHISISQIADKIRENIR